MTDQRQIPEWVKQEKAKPEPTGPVPQLSEGFKRRLSRPLGEDKKK